MRLIEDGENESKVFAAVNGNLTVELLGVQEEERRRIALEIHDGIGQFLTAIKFKAETLLRIMDGKKEAEIVSAINLILLLIRQAMEEVRRIQGNLRPAVLGEIGLIAAIQRFCGDFQIFYPGIRIKKDILLNEKDVPDPLKIVIFRVLQEAFHNAVKHSRADRIELSLIKGGGRLSLSFRDNGVGFDLEQLTNGHSKNGLGLSGMKERTESSGGRFSIQAHKGGGTILRASWQCD